MIILRVHDGVVTLTGWGFFLLAMLACLASATINVHK